MDISLDYIRYFATTLKPWRLQAVSLQDRNETAMGLLARCISPLEEDYYCSLSLAIEALYFAVGTAKQTDKWFTHMNAAHPIKEAQGLKFIENISF